MVVVLINDKDVMIYKIVKMVQMNRIVLDSRLHYKSIQKDKQYDKDKKPYFVVVMKVILVYK